MTTRHSVTHARRFAVLLMAAMSLAALAAGGVVAPSASASSAVSAAGCHAANCAGHDPTTHGCSATSTTSSSGALATVWNRYSAACDANWVRGQLTTAALNAGDQMEITISTIDSDTRRTSNRRTAAASAAAAG